MVLQLVGYGLLLLAFIITIASVDSYYYYYDIEDVIGNVVGGVIFVIIAGIVLLVGMVFDIIGTTALSKENEKFKIGFYMLLAFLALLVLYIIFGFTSIGPVIGIFLALTIAANAVMVAYVCGGIKDLGAKLGAHDVVQGQNAPLIVNLIAEGLFALGILLSMSAASETITGIFALLAWILSTVGLFLYIGYIRRAVRAVEGAHAVNQQYRY